MSDTFYFLDYEIQQIQNKKFICIYILDFDKHIIFKVFKLYSDNISEFLQNNVTTFSDITNFVNFAIKRDGKITLDINI